MHSTQMDMELLSKISSDGNATPKFISFHVIVIDFKGDVRKDFLNRYHNEFPCNSFENYDIITR